jgi:antirestriction protein ArdC
VAPLVGPDRDIVQMPELQTAQANATLAHEMTHWTRHESRLDRDLGRKRFADAGYAMEELVAEIGAAFLCADLGIRRKPATTTPPISRPG